ncbi:MAG: aldose 1-epimerase family protein [Bacillota bacterium]
MIYTIKNEFLSVDINDAGAELFSIKDKDGTEYLWQGDDTYWARRSPTLFPFVGRLTDGAYTLHGKKYEMDIHGFLKQSLFALVSQKEDAITFSLKDNESTLAQYPFSFEFLLSYTLKGAKLDVDFAVKNLSSDTMYFGIGAHPGFCVPLEEGLPFTSYFLEFGAKAEAVRMGVGDTCFLNGADEPFPLVDGVKIPLTHELFDRDAVVLKNVDRSLSLKSESGKKGLCVRYPDMPYMGIWSKPHTDAPYVCIEPWVSLPSAEGEIAELSTKADLVSLAASGTYKNGWSVEIING